MRNDPCELILYKWNMCKSKVDAPSYRNNKSSVDASSTMNCRVIGSMLLACETIPAG
jgi:hypothetical protein